MDPMPAINAECQKLQIEDDDSGSEADTTLHLIQTPISDTTCDTPATTSAHYDVNRMVYQPIEHIETSHVSATQHTSSSTSEYSVYPRVHDFGVQTADMYKMDYDTQCRRFQSESSPAHAVYKSNRQISNFEAPYIDSSREYAESFVEAARLLEEFKEQFYYAPFEFLQPEEFEPTEHGILDSRLSEYLSRKSGKDSNDSTFFDSDSDDGITVEIKSVKSAEVKSEETDKKVDKVPIVEKSIESGYYAVQVRDVATQFPEHGGNLWDTSTAVVDEPILLNMETQTVCTAVNQDGEATNVSLINANVLSPQATKIDLGKKI